MGHSQTAQSPVSGPLELRSPAGGRGTGQQRRWPWAADKRSRDTEGGEATALGARRDLLSGGDRQFGVWVGDCDNGSTPFGRRRRGGGGRHAEGAQVCAPAPARPGPTAPAGWGRGWGRGGRRRAVGGWAGCRGQQRGAPPSARGLCREHAVRPARRRLRPGAGSAWGALSADKMRQSRWAASL